MGLSMGISVSIGMCIMTSTGMRIKHFWCMNKMVPFTSYLAKNSHGARTACEASPIPI